VTFLALRRWPSSAWWFCSPGAVAVVRDWKRTPELGVAGKNPQGRDSGGSESRLSVTWCRCGHVRGRERDEGQEQVEQLPVTPAHHEYVAACWI
jgi:hypothetical protein